MYHVSMAVQCIYRCSYEGGEDGDGREWRLPGLFYADDLVLCVELENLRVMVRWFAEVCRRRGN